MCVCKWCVCGVCECEFGLGCLFIRDSGTDMVTELSLYCCGPAKAKSGNKAQLDID